VNDRPSEGDALVAVGVVARPHGVHGELRVHRLNPESTILFEVRRVVLRREADIREATIRGSRLGPKGAVLMIVEGVRDRDAAEAMRGTELCVPRSALPPTEEDEWYFVDLIGLAAETEDGTRLGDVVDVVEYPASICLAVRQGDEVREVPLGDPYLIGVRLEEGRVILSPIEDLPARKPNKHERQSEKS